MSSNLISRSAPFYGAPNGNDGSVLRGRFSLGLEPSRVTYSECAPTGRGVDASRDIPTFLLNLGRILLDRAQNCSVFRLLTNRQ